MSQEVRIYDKNMKLKKIISDKEVREKALASCMTPFSTAYSYKLKTPVERKCVCGVVFTTQVKRQINCNTRECLEKKKKERRDKKRREKEERKEKEKGEICDVYKNG
jgi:uncharacterized protein (DUF2062 family)